jgi:N-acyl-D-amino-acid deacylase
MRLFRYVLCLGLLLATAPQAFAEAFDLLIRNGVVYDGSGGAPQRLDVGVRGDKIARIGKLRRAKAKQVVDAQGLAVAPGFINMLSWATESLIVDGRAQSDVRQGVTLEVMGEGWSMGPVNAAMREESLRLQGDIKYPIEWTTLGEYLDWLVKNGISPNVASYVGATTVRIHELGYANRPPRAEEMRRMQDLVRAAMREGALGVGSSLIYAPAVYASTQELEALALAAADFGGGYITHMRSEGSRLLEGIDEVVRIAAATKQHAEIYHLKVAGQQNWPKVGDAIAKIEAARNAGLSVSANMYAYTAGATGLDAANPPWVQEGGHDAWVARLKDPAIRARVIAEMKAPQGEWENLYLAAGSPERLLLTTFKNDALKPLTGKSLAEVARLRGTSPEDTMIDLIIEDNSRVGTAYFLMSEENVERQLRLPWVSLGSDGEALAPEGVFLKSNPHPRAYGNAARFLGYYVRERKVATLPDAIRRLTSLPAANLKIRERGSLKPGYYADIVVFDPVKIQDHATYDKPHQYSTGVRHVFVNGVQVLRDGEHTGAKPGRVVRGPGYRPRVR